MSTLTTHQLPPNDQRNGEDNNQNNNANENVTLDQREGQISLTPKERILLRVILLSLFLVLGFGFEFIRINFMILFGKIKIFEDSHNNNTQAYIITTDPGLWEALKQSIYINSPSLHDAIASTEWTNFIQHLYGTADERAHFIFKYWIITIPAVIALITSVLSTLYHYIPLADKFLLLIYKTRSIFLLCLSTLFTGDAYLMKQKMIGTNPLMYLLSLLWIAAMFTVSALNCLFPLSAIAYAERISGITMMFSAMLFGHISRNASGMDFSLIFSQNIISLPKDDEGWGLFFVNSFIGWNERGNSYFRVKWVTFAISFISFLTGIYMFHITRHLQKILLFVKDLLNRGGKRILSGSILLGFCMTWIAKHYNDEQSVKSTPSLLFATFPMTLLGCELFFFQPGTLIKRTLSSLQENYYNMQINFHSRFVLRVLLLICFNFVFCLNRLYSVDNFNNFSFRKTFGELFLAVMANAFFEGFTAYLLYDILKAARDPVSNSSNINQVHLNESRGVNNDYDISSQNPPLTRANAPHRIKFSTQRKILSYGTLITRLIIMFAYIMNIVADNQSQTQADWIPVHIFHRFGDFLWIWLSILAAYCIYASAEADEGFEAVDRYDIFQVPFPDIQGVKYFRPSTVTVIVSFSSFAYFITVAYRDRDLFLLRTLVDLSFAVIAVIPGIAQLGLFQIVARYARQLQQKLGDLIRQYPQTFSSLLFHLIPGVGFCLTMTIEFIVIGANLIIYGLAVVGSELEWTKLSYFCGYCIHIEKILLRLIRAVFTFMFSVVFLNTFIERKQIVFLLASYVSLIATIYLFGDAIANDKIKRFALSLFKNLDFAIPKTIRYVIYESGLFATIKKILESIKNGFLSFARTIAFGMTGVIVPTLKALYNGILVFWNNASSTFLISATVLISLFLVYEYQIDTMTYDFAIYAVNEAIRVAGDAKEYISTIQYNDSTIQEIVSVGGAKLLNVATTSGPMEWAQVVQQVSSITDAAQLLKMKSFATAFYLIPLFLSKTRVQDVIKGKIIIVPLTLLLGCFGFAPSMFKFVFAASLIHFLASIAISIHEHRERTRAETRYESWRRERENHRRNDDSNLTGRRLGTRASATSETTETQRIKNVFEQVSVDLINSNKEKYEVCTICLESNLGKVESVANDKISVKLRNCDHVFHNECIMDWITSGSGSSRRCPNCREPVDEQNVLVSTLF